MAARGQQQRVAVRTGPRDRGRGDGAARAGLGLDHEGLPQPLGHLGADRARDGVGVAAGREALQDADRALGIGLGPGGRARECEAAGDGSAGLEEMSALHACLLVSVSVGPVTAGPRAGGAQVWATMGLRSRPTDSISTSTTSPGFMYHEGLRLQPTPAGVPVMITSPGTSVKMVDA